MKPEPGVVGGPESLVDLIGRIIGAPLAAELLIAALLLVLAVVAPRQGSITGAERFLGRVSPSPATDILLVGLLAIALRALLLPFVGFPYPLAHDEYSHLFQAETFLAGRMVNPVPLFPEHFESIHLNVVPAYASMYFPGRSIPMLLGIIVGHPWFGVWATVVGMSMAAVWMLQAWVSRPLALLGGILVVLRFGLFGHWINSYWGGAFTALGATLVLGALPRLLKEPRWPAGLAMGIGVTILLTTRPFEGGVFCLPLAVYMLFRLFRSEPRFARRILVRAGVPVALFGAAGAGWLLAYNAATTGQALLTPYEMNRQAYAITPPFLIQPAIDGEQRGPPHFRPFYEWENLPYEARQSPARLIRGAVAKFYYMWVFYVGLVLTPAFLAGLWAARRKPLLLATLGIFMTAFLFQTWPFTHYAAPIFPVILVIILMGFGWLQSWLPKGRRVGPFLTRAMPAGVLLALALPTVAVVADRPSWVGRPSSLLPCCTLPTKNPREVITDFLDRQPGRHLVLVSTDPMRHPLHAPMIYNAPDLERAPIVWAHLLGPARDAPFLAHHGSRRHWEVHWRDDGSPIIRERHSRGRAP